MAAVRCTPKRAAQAPTLRQSQGELNQPRLLSQLCSSSTAPALVKGEEKAVKARAGKSTPHTQHSTPERWLLPPVLLPSEAKVWGSESFWKGTSKLPTARDARGWRLPCELQPQAVKRGPRGYSANQGVLSCPKRVFSCPNGFSDTQRGSSAAQRGMFSGSKGF